MLLGSACSCDAPRAPEAAGNHGRGWLCVPSAPGFAAPPRQGTSLPSILAGCRALRGLISAVPVTKRSNRGIGGRLVAPDLCPSVVPRPTNPAGVRSPELERSGFLAPVPALPLRAGMGPEAPCQPRQRLGRAVRGQCSGQALSSAEVAR